MSSLVPGKWVLPPSVRELIAAVGICPPPQPGLLKCDPLRSQSWMSTSRSRKRLHMGPPGGCRPLIWKLQNLTWTQRWQRRTGQPGAAQGGMWSRCSEPRAFVSLRTWAAGSPPAVPAVCLIWKRTHPPMKPRSLPQKRRSHRTKRFSLRPSWSAPRSSDTLKIPPIQC